MNVDQGPKEPSEEQALGVKGLEDSEAERPPQPRLKVWLTSFPESNGRLNWTAMLIREIPLDGLIGNCGGISLARGEFWNRVAYAAECARYLIGDRETEPFIGDFGKDIVTPDEWAGEVHLARRKRPSATGQGTRETQE